MTKRVCKAILILLFGLMMLISCGKGKDNSNSDSKNHNNGNSNNNYTNNNFNNSNNSSNSTNNTTYTGIVYNYDGQDLSGQDFSNRTIDFTYSFKGANLYGANFNNVKFEYGNFENANLEKASFLNIKLYGDLNFNGANLSYAKFTFDPPHYPYTINLLNAKLVGTSFKSNANTSDPSDDVSYFQGNLNNANFSHSTFENVSIECYYYNIINNTNIKHTCVNVDFSNTTFNNYIDRDRYFARPAGWIRGFPASNFNDANINSYTMGGDFSSSNFTNAKLENINMGDRASFNNTDFTNAQFKILNVFDNYYLTYLDHGITYYYNAIFTNVNIDCSQFEQTSDASIFMYQSDYNKYFSSCDKTKFTIAP